jgi:hypothetical protein
VPIDNCIYPVIGDGMVNVLSLNVAHCGMVQISPKCCVARARHGLID